MTGRYNFRNYTQFGTLPAAEPTFGHMMGDAGYATCILGKWQLEGKGGTTPDCAGFDEYYMYGGNPHADLDIKDNDWEDVQQKKGEYGPDLCVDYLCDFLDRQSEELFFIYYPMHLPHFYFEPTPDSDVWESGNRHERDDKYFTDMVEYMDKLLRDDCRCDRGQAAHAARRRRDRWRQLPFSTDGRGRASQGLGAG